MRTMTTVIRTAIVATATADSADAVVTSNLDPSTIGAASSTTMNATEASRPRPPRRRITFEAYRRGSPAAAYRTYLDHAPQRSRRGQHPAHHPRAAVRESRSRSPVGAGHAGILARSSTPAETPSGGRPLLEEGASFVP